MTQQTYYVTATWHNFPEGGTCGELILADSYHEAEFEMSQRMALYELENWFREEIEDAGGEEAAFEQILENYQNEWHIVDCYPLVMNTINNLSQLTEAEREKLKEALNG